MLYHPIKNQQDFESLIHIGETSESKCWDYKQEFNDDKASDIAIDLAAFANTCGGSLLIGVSEKNIDGRKVANSFFNVENYEKIKSSVYTKIFDLIFPHIDVQVIPININDILIVAINVDPSVNLVGVCLDKDRRSFCFPWRTEYGNQYMPFEEVEKRMMDNKSRIIYLKLQKYLPSGGKVNLYPFPRGNYQSEWSVEWINGFEDEVRLAQNRFRSIVVPLSFIDEVWKGHEGVCMKMNTRLYCSPSFIDFENSEKVAIYEVAVRNAIETQNFLDAAHKKIK